VGTAGAGQTRGAARNIPADAAGGAARRLRDSMSERVGSANAGWRARSKGAPQGGGGCREAGGYPGIAGRGNQRGGGSGAEGHARLRGEKAEAAAGICMRAVGAGRSCVETGWCPVFHRRLEGLRMRTDGMKRRRTGRSQEKQHTQADRANGPQAGMKASDRHAENSAAFLLITYSQLTVNRCRRQAARPLHALYCGRF
jgi:hypothetical protein